MSIKFDMEKFDGKISFSIWRVQMQAVLSQNGLKKALLGKSKKPELMTDEQWDELDEKALSAIQLCLTKEVLREVIHESTAESLWLKLEALYMTKSLANKLRLKERLYTIRMAEGTPIQTHFNEFNSILIDLESIEIIIDDEDKALLLIVSLPPSYKHFKEIMLYGNNDKLSFEDVKSNLLSKEKFDLETNDDKGEGLNIMGRKKTWGTSKNSRSKQKGKNNNKHCNYCKKKGHDVSECYTLKNKKEKGNRKHDNKPAEAAVIETDSDGELLMTDTSKRRNSDQWVMDSGCTFHMCPRRDWFSTYEAVDCGVVLMGNDAQCRVIGIGTVQVKTHDGHIRTLSDVRHIPDLKRNLISIGTLDSRGCSYSGGGGVLTVSKGKRILFKANRQGSLYILQGSTVTGTAAVTTSSSSDDLTKLWHMRLGHMSEKHMQVLSRRGLLGDQGTVKLDFCEHCVFGKLKRASFHAATHSTLGPLDYIHADLWGPTKHPSFSGKRYFMSIIDDYSRKVWVMFLRQKNEAFPRFKKWKALVENQSGKRIKTLRTDNGLEFCETDFTEYCAEYGIGRHRTLVKKPQQNGVAERMNRTLLERARCMLSNAGLWHRRDFWAEAVSTACYLVNRSPHSALDFKIPEEVWTGKPITDFTQLKVFGCPAYCYDNNGKLAPRAIKCIFIGYSAESKGYRFWSPNSRRVILSRDVKFNENALLFSGIESTVSSSSTSDQQGTDDKVEIEKEVQVQPSYNSASSELPQVSTDPHGNEDDNIVESSNMLQQDYNIARDRNRRETRRPMRYRDDNDDGLTAYALAVAQDIPEGGDPTTYKQTITCAKSSQWLAAVIEEMESLYKNNTWDSTENHAGEIVVKKVSTENPADVLTKPLQIAKFEHCLDLASTQQI